MNHPVENTITLTRRDAIRLTGSGLLLAALPGCAGWSMPDVATAPWRRAGDGEDPRLRALSWALLAPSPHNRQAWLADLRRSGEIALSVDTARMLPQTDPPGRQTTIGQGAFLEILDMALREEGLLPRITLFPQGEYGGVPDERPVARVALEPHPGVNRDPLFAVVPRRHTNRTAYDTARAVTPSTLDALLATPVPEGVEVSGTVDPALRGLIAELALRGMQIEVVTPRIWCESVELVRIGASEIGQNRDGISVTGFVPWLGRKLGLVSERSMIDPGGSAVKMTLDSSRDQAHTAGGWMWLATRGNMRRQQVDAGRAYVRLQLAATLAGLGSQPMSQLLQEFPEMAGAQADLYRALGLDPSRVTLQMLARVGHAEPVDPSSRRALASIVRL